MLKIASVKARRILDSRGNPTIEARVLLEGGDEGIASAPSGASTGSHEAVEIRDGGEAFCGRDVLRAVGMVNGEIARTLSGMDAGEQQKIDGALLQLDGTENFARIGGNAAIAVSQAVCAAAAAGRGVPLWQHIRDAFSLKNEPSAPCPMMNLINGGVHADNDLDVQEFMILPVGAGDFEQAIRMGVEIQKALGSLLKKSGRSTAVGDEGGFAPSLGGDERALEFLTMAVERAGYKPGRDAKIGIDAAAAGWQEGKYYRLKKAGFQLTPFELASKYRAWARRYPLCSIEDPLGEEDFDGFAKLSAALGEGCMTVGDDLYTTNARRVMTGITKKSTGALLVKPNQAGTLTGTMDAALLARSAGIKLALSHRSGETESAFLADLAYALGAEYLKSGAPVRGERTVKYNRMLLLASGGWEKM